MDIRRFEIDMLDDWLDFFDHRGFHDHAEWDGCYCTFYHYPKPKTCPVSVSTKRDYAIWLLKNGMMDGYAVYDNNKIVGWCNVGAKINYSKLASEENDTVSIVCFLMEKDYRKKGIAGMILEEIIKNSREGSYAKIEAYPNFDPATEYSNYHGSVRMYSQAKFMEVRQHRKRKMVLTLK